MSIVDKGLTPAKSRTTCRVEYAALFIVIAVGVGLRCAGLSLRSMRFDEAVVWRMSRFDWFEMIERCGKDNSLPLHLLLVRGWTAAFGDSVVALRSLSAALGSSAIVAMYLFAREAFRSRDASVANGDNSSSAIDPTPPRSGEAGTEPADVRAMDVALLTAALTATSVLHISWARDARTIYVLGTALAAWSTWALIRAVRDPQQRFRWLLYAVFALAFAYTHYYALFTLAAHALFVAGWLSVRILRRAQTNAPVREVQNALAAGVFVAAGWLPWLSTFLTARARVRGSFWTEPVDASDVSRALYVLFVEPRDSAPGDFVMEFVSAVCLIAVASLLWRAKSGAWLTFAAAVAPFALAVGVTQTDTQVFSVRYLLFAHLFLLVAIAHLVCRLPRPGRLAVGAVLLLNFLLIDVVYWQKMAFAERPGVRGAVQWIAERRTEGEPVVVSAPLFYLPVRYHVHDSSTVFLFTDGRQISHYYGTAVLTAEDLITIETLNESAVERVWTVNNKDGVWVESSVELPANWKRRQVSPVFPEAFRGLQGDVLVEEWTRVPTGGRKDESGRDTTVPPDRQGE